MVGGGPSLSLLIGSGSFFASCPDRGLLNRVSEWQTTRATDSLATYASSPIPAFGDRPKERPRPARRPLLGLAHSSLGVPNALDSRNNAVARRRACVGA